MQWLVRALGSSIGGKLVTAVTGLGLMIFLVGHLSGNLLVFKGPKAMNDYAQMLHDLGPLLWVARIGLLVTFALHIYLSVTLNLRNMAARPVPYAYRNYAAATFASRTMLPTGLMILAFVIYHLLHFTLGVTDPANYAAAPGNLETVTVPGVIDPLQRPDVYSMVVKGFQNPLVSLVYVFAMVMLGLHLSHGASSVFQTLGLNHPKYNPLFRLVGPGFAAVIVAGYVSIPLSILFGLVKLPG